MRVIEVQGGAGEWDALRVVQVSERVVMGQVGCGSVRVTVSCG